MLANCRSQFLLDQLGDVSNCSYRLPVHPLMNSRLSSAKYFLYAKNTPKHYREDRTSLKCLLNEKGRNAGHGRSITSDQPNRQEHDKSILQFSLSLSVSLSVCRLSQTTGRNACSIVSGDVSNCSYRLTVHPVTSSCLSSA